MTLTLRVNVGSSEVYDDIAGGLGIHRNEAIKHVEKLIGDKVIERFDLSGKHFYRKPEK